MKIPAPRPPQTRPAPPPLRRSALAALIAASFGAAHANPTLPQVLTGQATFTQDGKLFSITNTPNTIINWHSFSIGAGEITRFTQQSASSAVLNRITGQDPSAILGSLQSNGKVFLINPNGILFGANARVDVNGLVASSLNLSNQDFLAGAMNFTASGQAGNVSNQGAIHAADGGQVLLIAPNVENTGLITAPNGDVLLAAGHSVQLADAANPALRFVVAAGGQALNVGQVIAQGGRIGMAGAVVRQRGVLSADSAQVGPGGAIVLRASGQALLEAGGVTSARAASGNGGTVTVLGDQVGLLGDARVDASGATGGGTVLLGGDYQGRNPAIPNARQVAIESGVAIAADAIDSGNGGKVIAWGDRTARVFGSISARGGALSGNGGLVETSGHYLDAKGLRVDTGAARGKRGTWLLDPYDITVVAGSGGSLAAVDNFDDAPNTGVTEIGAALLAGASSDVLLQAAHNITFNSAIEIATPGVSLAAAAGASIALNAPISTNNGSITLSANDVTSGHAYGGGSNVLLNAALNSRGGAVTVSGNSIVGAGAIDTGSGNLDLRAIGAVTSSDNEAADGLVTLGGALTVGGDLRASAASTLRSTGAVSVGGMFRLEGGDWIQNTASLPLFFVRDFAVTGGTFLRAAGGDGATAPYRIVDTYGLQGMSRHNAPLNFTLADSIDASGTASWNEGQGFKSIYGGDGYAWQGSFDGAAYAITGLVINDSGLFRSLNGGTVSNLTLAGSVHGGVYTGAVTGLNAGTISNVHSSMNVTGDQTSGGLVGYNAGLVTGSSSSGNVTLTGNTAGGLVGYNDGTARITLSSASGNVSALGNSAGGLVGTNSNTNDHSGSITSSFATGSVSAASNVGGLVGTNYGMVSRAYATGAVRLADGAMDLAHVNMGGLIGASNGGIATEIYSTGQVIGTGFDAGTVGGLVGSSTVSALEGGYWDIGTSGQAGDHGGGAGLTHAQMQQPASFIGFDFSNTWRIYADQTTPLIKALLTPVTVTATAAATKVYDGQLATFGGTLGYAGLLAGDTGVDGSAGYGTALNVGTYALGGLYSTKYDITLAGNTQLAVTPRVLTATISGSKVYDSTTSLNGAAFSLNNVVEGDILSVTGTALFDDKNAGTGKSVGASDVALSGNTFGNYTLSSSANGAADIARATLTVAGVGASSKVYDGTTFATLMTKLGGVQGADQVSVTSPVAAFTDKNAGAGKTVNYSIANASLGGADAANYQIAASGGVTADIAMRALYVGYTPASKVYDGTTAASATLSDTRIAGDVLAVTGTATFDSRNAGSNAVTLSGISATGIDAANYSVVAPDYIAFASITPRALTATISGSKVYDGGVGLSGATFTLSNVVAGDTVSASGAASFADKNAASVKTLSASGISLAGDASANYTVAGTAVGTGAITRASLVLGSVSAGNKVYDGGTGATVSAVLGGVIGSDQVNLAAPVGSFSDKNVGAAKAVTYIVTDASLSGADAANYQLSASGSTTAAITARALNIAYTANGKVYDATTAATVALSDDRLAGDVLSIAANASFADKHVGTKAVSLSNVALQGVDAGNYGVVLPATAVQATITPAMLAAKVTATNKVYDATTGATVSATLGGVLGADQVGLSGASGSFADKNVGTAKSVSYTVALNGADAGNYQLASNGTTTADITARALNIGYTANGKVYDATAAAIVALSDDRIAGDAVSIAANASFADKNVGTKAVSLSNLVLQGADAGNYTVVLPAAPMQATITPAALALAGITASDKVYDGTRTAAVGASVTGVLGQDAVVATGGSGTFADSNHGAGKTVVATGFGLAGADAGNYTLAATGGVAQASIAQKALSTWIGAGNGLWSDAANWDGGVVPLADNVLAATIASATGTIGYTATAGATVLQTLTSSAGLTVSGGSLTLGHATLAGLNFTGGAVQVDGSLATAGYAQSAGTLAGAGSLAVGSSFSQAGGAIALGGDVALTQLAGDLRVVSVAGAAVSLNAAGAIGQSGAISATSLVTRSQSGTVLDHSGNHVASFTATNSGSGGIALTNSTVPGQLVLGSLSTGAGNIAIDNTGGIESHAIAANGGNVSLVAHSPVTVLGAITGNDVAVQASTWVALTDGASINALRNVAITAGSDLTLDGSAALNAGNRLALTAGDSLLLKGAATLEVPAAGNMALLAQRGSIVAGAGVRIDSHGAPVSLSAPNGTVTAPAGVFVGATLAGVSTGGVPLATPAVATPVLNYASTVSQQYNPLKLSSSPSDPAQALVSIAPVAATPLEEKLTGSTDAKKMYCN